MKRSQKMQDGDIQDDDTLAHHKNMALTTNASKNSSFLECQVRQSIKIRMKKWIKLKTINGDRQG